jgi:hypothetical protein
MVRKLVLTAGALVAATLVPGPALAQGIDLTIFAGRAYPIYDERLTIRPSSPSLPGVNITVAEPPVLTADGGPVFGGALAFQLGPLGIEGRLDATEVGFDFTGARYELRGAQPPFDSLSAVVTMDEGRLDADRIQLLSINGRLRTPGPVGLVVSGGLTYLPDIRVTGAVPLGVQIAGLPSLGGNARLTLRATPDQDEHRWGVNGGAGLRFGGRIGVMAEVRGFYFREYELRFAVDDAPALVEELLEAIDPVRFTPIFVNAQVGLLIRF